MLILTWQISDIHIYWRKQRLESDLKDLLINASNAPPLHKGICLSCYLRLQRLSRHVLNSFGIHVEYKGSCKSRVYLSNARWSPAEIAEKCRKEAISPSIAASGI